MPSILSLESWSLPDQPSSPSSSSSSFDAPAQAAVVTGLTSVLSGGQRDGVFGSGRRLRLQEERSGQSGRVEGEFAGLVRGRGAEVGRGGRILEGHGGCGGFGGSEAGHLGGGFLGRNHIRRRPGRWRLRGSATETRKSSFSLLVTVGMGDGSASARVASAVPRPGPCKRSGFPSVDLIREPCPSVRERSPRPSRPFTARERTGPWLRGVPYCEPGAHRPRVYLGRQRRACRTREHPMDVSYEAGSHTLTIVARNEPRTRRRAKLRAPSARAAPCDGRSRSTTSPSSPRSPRGRMPGPPA